MHYKTTYKRSGSGSQSNPKMTAQSSVASRHYDEIISAHSRWRSEQGSERRARARNFKGHKFFLGHMTLPSVRT